MTRLRLGSYPTPVEPLGELAKGLWTKHDDRTGTLYGGNKVRKLELVLGAARDAGKTHILTLGAVGSHQVVATALYGEANGFTTEAVLVPQPRTPHAERNLRVALAHGLRATPAPAWAVAPAWVLSRLHRETFFVPVGASTPLGSLGFVDAAHELAAQVASGAMPEPDTIVVALGSGGTVAGLAAGLEATGLRTRVVGVAVSHPVPILGYLARRLARRTAALAGIDEEAAAARIDVAGQWVGHGYGHPTPEGEAATTLAVTRGLTLDPTYTAKAFACALAMSRAEPDKTILYWHTLSTVPLDPLLGAWRDAPLPDELRSLFT